MDEAPPVGSYVRYKRSIIFLDLLPAPLRNGIFKVELPSDQGSTDGFVHYTDPQGRKTYEYLQYMELVHPHEVILQSRLPHAPSN